MNHSDPTSLILLYFVLPVWYVAGFADWICHRRTHIERTSGIKESLIHALMFAESGAGLLPGIYLQVNSLVIAIMAVMFLMHHATAYCDISYAVTARKITTVEHMVHSFLEIIPLMALASVIALNWGQFLALFGLGAEQISFAIEWKKRPLGTSYVVWTVAVIFFFEFIPYAEEVARCARERK